MSSSNVEKPEEINDPNAEEVLDDDDLEEEEEELDDINTSDRESDEDTDFSTYKERLAVKPSTNIWDSWIICRTTKAGTNGLPAEDVTQQIGKYLIFEDEKHIDSSWEKIKAATEDGLLGFASKVSTKKGKRRGIDGGFDTQVICVYTKYTSSDESDKTRVLQALRKLGYNRHLPYKTDAATLAGIYSDKFKKERTDIEDDAVEYSDEDSEYSAAETDTSRGGDGDVSGKGTEPGSDSESEYSDLPKKHKSDGAQRTKDSKSVEYVRMYTTVNTYTLDVYLHIKQMTSTGHSGKQDILFPMDQASDIAESVYELGHAVLEDEKDTEDGITTSHVKLHAGYSSDFKAHAVFIKSTKDNSMVSFPLTDAVFYYSRIEWYRQHRS
jgi:hypothetical protein